jgi:hypothetical protein
MDGWTTQDRLTFLVQHSLRAALRWWRSTYLVMADQATALTPYLLGMTGTTTLLPQLRRSNTWAGVDSICSAILWVLALLQWSQALFVFQLPMLKQPAPLQMLLGTRLIAMDHLNSSSSSSSKGSAQSLGPVQNRAPP